MLRKYWKKAPRNAHGYVNQRASKELQKYVKFRASRVIAGKQSALVRSTSSTHVQQVLNNPNPNPKPYPNPKEGGSPNRTLSQDHASGNRPNGPKIPLPKEKYLSEKERRNQEIVQQAIQEFGRKLDD